MPDPFAADKRIQEKRETSLWIDIYEGDTDQIFGADVGKPAAIELKSINCKAARDAERAYQAQRTLAKANGEDLNLRDLELHAKHIMDMLVLVTQNWRNFDIDGEPYACTPNNIRRLYGCDWIFNQVLAKAYSPKEFGLEEETPPDIVEDAEKKSETGQDGSLPLEVASALAQ